MNDSNEAEDSGASKTLATPSAIPWRLWGLLSFLLLVLPQASFLAILMLSRWSFGNMIWGKQEFAVLHGLLGLASGLSIYPGFFVFLFVFLLSAVWWKRLFYTAVYLIAHLIVTTIAFGWFQQSQVFYADSGTVEISVQSSHLWQAPLLGASVIFAAVLVQWFLGWRFSLRTSGHATSPITVATLLEGVASCGIVFACWYQAFDLKPGQELRIETYDFGMAAFPALGIIVSTLILARFLLADSSWKTTCVVVIALLLVQAGVYALAWLTLRWSDFGDDDPMVPFAALSAAIVSLVATICLALCWYCAKAMGYQLMTYRLTNRSQNLSSV